VEPENQSRRWYRKGLNFECSQCGDCCRGPGYVWVDAPEIKRIATFLEVSPEAFARQYLRRVGGQTALIDNSAQDCIFWDQGCTIYPVRPRQCQTFPFWEQHLATPEAWNEVDRECPGVNEGRHYPLTEIAALLSGSRSTGPQTSGDDPHDDDMGE
jgi:Fe-S-cluster containining protein